MEKLTTKIECLVHHSLSCSLPNGATTHVTHRCSRFGRQFQNFLFSLCQPIQLKTQGINLQDWHEAANAFDDDDETGDTGVTLTTYAFMKGVEAGEELGITSPGTVMFVNAQGEITATKVGILEEPQEVLDLWETAQ